MSRLFEPRARSPKRLRSGDPFRASAMILNRWGALMAVVFLAGCMTVPAGPVVLVMPAKGRPLSAFQRDDTSCRVYAEERLGERTAQTAVMESVGGGLLFGAVLGALTGGAIKGAEGARTGAAIGAAGGALGGYGASYGTRSTLQVRYDNAYMQCMHTRGHRLPPGVLAESTPAEAGAAAQTGLQIGVPKF